MGNIVAELLNRWNTNDGSTSCEKVALFGDNSGTLTAVAVDGSGNLATSSGAGAAASDTNYFQATITSADATSATQVKAKTADKKINVTSLIVSTDTAMNIQFQDDAGTPVVLMEQIYLAANGGFAMSAASSSLPIMQVDTNQDLDVIASAAGNISVQVSGYVV